MNVNLPEPEKVLRLVRLFLTRLNRDDLIEEIERETEHERTRLRNGSRDRIAAGRGEIENRIDERTRQIASLELKSAGWSLVLFAGMLGLVLGTPIAAANDEGLAGIIATVFIVVGVGGLAALVKNDRRIDEYRTELASLERELRLREEDDESDKNGGRGHPSASLQSRCDALVRHYEDSIATTEEAVELCDATVTVLAERAETASDHLRAVSADRCAVGWVPSAFQPFSLPDPVVEEASESAREIRDRADDIIAPMQSAFSSEDQWSEFRNRIVPLLGLASGQSGIAGHGGGLQVDRVFSAFASSESSVATGRHGCARQLVEFNVLKAVAFSANTRTYILHSADSRHRFSNFTERVEQRGIGY